MALNARTTSFYPDNLVAAMLLACIPYHTPKIEDIAAAPVSVHPLLHVAPEIVSQTPEITAQELLQRNFSEDFTLLKSALQKHTSREPSTDLFSTLSNFADQACSIGDLFQAKQTLEKFNRLPKKERILIFDFVITKLEELLNKKVPKMSEKAINSFLLTLKNDFQKEQLLSLAPIIQVAMKLNDQERVELLATVSEPTPIKTLQNN